jgi:hypothetical protein
MKDYIMMNLSLSSMYLYLSSHLKENTLRRHYKDHSVKALWKIMTVHSENQQNPYIQSLLKQLTQIVTTLL